MGRRREIIILCIGLAYAVAWAFLHPPKPPEPLVEYEPQQQDSEDIQALLNSYGGRPGVPPVDSMENQKKLWDENSAALEPQLKAACGPGYQTSCLLDDALARLQRHGFADEDPYQGLLQLANAVSLTNNASLQAKLLLSLETQTTRLWAKDRPLRLAMMNLHFAMDDFEGAKKILESFRDETEPFKFGQSPPTSAITALVLNGKADEALQIAQETRSWPITIETPPMGCFGSGGSNGDSLRLLMTQSLKAQKFANMPVLLDIASEDKGPFHDDRSIEVTLFEIGNYYNAHPDTPKPDDAKLCKRIYDLSDNKRMYQSSVWVLTMLGCKEQVDAAKRFMTLYDSWPEQNKHALPPEVLIAMGDNNAVFKSIDDAVTTRDKIYRAAEVLMRYKGLGKEQEERAFQAFKSLYDGLDHGIDAEGAEWNSTYLNTIKNAGYKKEYNKILEDLIVYVKKGGHDELIPTLAGMVDRDHPDYPWIAQKTDEYYFIKNMRSSLQMVPNTFANYITDRVVKLIKAGKITEAENLYKTLPPMENDYTYQVPVFDALLQTDADKGEWFQTFWPQRMKDCMSYNLTHFKSNDPDLLVGRCTVNILEPSITNNRWKAKN